MNQRLPHIALVGNPNSGKTSLFNSLTGLHQKVGNFPGVTVEKKTGRCRLSKTTNATIIDLPGTYSLYPKRADEWVTYKVLMQQDEELQPDLVVVVADASNLKRNLLFVSQLIDLNIPLVLVLTMMDIARARSIQINCDALGEALGIPVIPVNPRKNSGIALLKRTIEEKLSSPAKQPASFLDSALLAPEAIAAAKQLQPSLSNYAVLHRLIHYRSLSLPMPEQAVLGEMIQKYKFSATRVQAEEILQRYRNIHQIMERAVKEPTLLERKAFADKLDQVLLHRQWGYVILMTVLFFLFQSIFWIASYPMDWIEHVFTALGSFLSAQLPSDRLISDVVINGIVPGLSGIFVFVPQIMILFGLITLLEETGYMARISFLTDKVMRRSGLNGKSVMPMISGFACAVPAIMSVRNIENMKERLLTILVTPLMSCSARLPVYTILIGLVIPETYFFGVLSLQGLVMMGLYLFGVLVALAVAWIAKRFIDLKEKSFFILELPLYRSPRWKNVFYTMIEKARIFVFDAGKIIMIISLVLWVLSNYGPSDQMHRVAKQYDQLLQTQPQQAEQLQKQKQAALLEHSYAGTLGKYIEPAIAPLGYDWKIGIALITSFAAREVFVGTMATLYSVDNAEEDTQSLREKMQSAVRADGTKVYTLGTGISLMIFYLLAMQCMSTLAVVKRETRSWKWPLIQLFYMTALAYGFSFLAYQLLS